jgi:hypothetical protein
MYLTGDGVTAILEWLNTDGILTPKQYFQAKGVGTEKMAHENLRWGKNVVREILANRVYCGDIARGKNKTNSRVTARMPVSECVVTENKHEAIVTREMFEKVQEIRKSANNSSNARYDTPAIENIFRGKLVCGHCGRSLERQRTSEHIYKFRCPTRYSYTKADCVPVLIKDSEIRDKLLDMLRFFNFEIPRSHNDEGIENGKNELLDIQAERRKNQHLLDSLYESLIMGDITDIEYREMKTTFTTKLSDLAAREKLLRQSGLKQTKHNGMLSKASESLDAARNGAGLTAEIVNGLIEKIHIFEDKSLRVKFTFIDNELPSREVYVYE